MKKSIQIFVLLFCILISAQAPEKFSYQAVIRNAANALVTNASVGLKVSILKSSNTGNIVYAESQTPTTNANGLISIQIGGGTVISGTIAAIDWSADSYFIKTETDPAGGTNYTITGTSQLLSVPYALYSNNSGSGPAFTLPYSGTYAAGNLDAFKITNNGSSLRSAGVFENTNASNKAPALLGTNNSTGGIGIQGSANSNTNGNLSIGVSGFVTGNGNRGAGIAGFAPNALGVYGSTDTGAAVYGVASGNGSGGAFKAPSTGNALYTNGPLNLTNIGEGPGKVLTTDGTGNATWQDVGTPFIHFSSVGGSDQFLSKGTQTIINSWVNNEETGGANYNTTTGEYTIPLTGYYSIETKVGFAVGNTLNSFPASATIYIDNVIGKVGYNSSAVAATFYNDIFVKIEKKLTSGQRIKIGVVQNGRDFNALLPEASTLSINLLHK